MREDKDFAKKNTYSTIMERIVGSTIFIYYKSFDIYFLFQLILI